MARLPAACAWPAVANTRQHATITLAPFIRSPSRMSGLARCVRPLPGRAEDCLRLTGLYKFLGRVRGRRAGYNKPDGAGVEGRAMPIRTRRWNDPREPDDGFRLLVCR